MSLNKKTNKFTEAQTIKKDRFIVYLFILIAVPAILYFRVLDFRFSNLDDSNIIIGRYDIIGNLENIKDAFTHDAFLSNEGDSFYRPVQTISFMIDAQIGGKEPWIYHLSNLILHMFTVIALLFFLIKFGVKREIAFLLSLFFSIHPMFTHAVAWIPARGDLLLGLFSLLSFITFLDYFEKGKSIYLVLNFIAFAIALFSKETAVLLPVLLMFYLYFTKKRKFILKEILPYFAFWFISFVIFFTLRQSVIKVNHPANEFGAIPLIQNLQSIPITFGKLFVPYNLSTMPYFDIIALIIGAAVMLGFIAITLKFINGEKRVVIWGAVWFLAFSIPPMLLSTHNIGYDYFEYRAYLPLMGILLIMGILSSRLFKDVFRIKFLTVAIPFLLIYAIIAFIHSTVFADPISFFTSAVEGNSNNAVAINSRGSEYFHGGNAEKSMSDFESAIKIWPTYSSPYFNEGILYHSAGNTKKAEYYFSEALKYDTLTPGRSAIRFDIINNLSGEKIALKKYHDAIVLLKKAAAEFQVNSDVYNNIGVAYFLTSRYDSSIYFSTKAIETQSNCAPCYKTRGGSKYLIKDYNGALFDYNKAKELDPNSPGSWYDTGNTKLELNDFEGAISDLSTAISMNSNWGEAYYRRGLAYSKAGKQDKAEIDWTEAKKLGFINNDNRSR